jgi:hypothetical protein
MTLATLVFAVLTMLAGTVILLSGSRAAYAKILKVLRSRVADGVLLVPAAMWFLWIVLNLGQADFGDYKNILFIAFLGVAVGSWFFVPDFLCVRAACALYMLLSWHLLQAAYGHYEVPARLWMVSGVYVGLVAGLYFAAIPYRMRDLFEWLSTRTTVARIGGGVLVAYGLWTAIVPFVFYK